MSDHTAPMPGTVPRDEPFTRPFWAALAGGKLITTRCADCGNHQFPPRVVCQHCWSSDLTWEPLSGKGILRSYTEVHAGPGVFAAELPYVIGLVDLVENVRVAARIAAAYDDLAVDRPVVLRPADRAGVPILTFTPATGVAAAERSPT